MRRGTVGFKNTACMSLSEFQQRVASLVLSLAEAEGFALAGGGALIAHGVVDRTTRDLDCFGPTRAAVDRLWPAIRNRLLTERFEVDVHQSDHGFAKMSVTDLATGETTQVDVGFDPAFHASVAMSIGSVRALDDLAGDKLLALFGRAAPRDFVDVHALRDRFTRRTLESLAAAKVSASISSCCAMRSACSATYHAPRSRWMTPRSCSCATNSKAGAQRSARLSTSRASSEPTPTWALLAEVDGNRTRRTRIARPNRFEGGGAHQVLGHLRPLR